MTKSYVTLEQHCCPVCVKTFDTDALLLDRRLRDTFESKTVTDWEFCEACEKLKRGGYIALVEADPERGDNTPGGAYRTGNIAHIKSEAFGRVFDVPVPEGGLCFMEPGVIEKLQEMMPED